MFRKPVRRAVDTETLDAVLTWKISRDLVFGKIPENILHRVPASLGDVNEDESMFQRQQVEARSRILLSR